MCGTSQRAGIWRLSLEQIEATVANHLGRGRVLGNQRGPCFSRQISMYLGRRSEGGARRESAGSTTAAITPPFFTRLGRLNAFEKPMNPPMP
jgi:hypothetical protein